MAKKNGDPFSEHPGELLRRLIVMSGHSPTTVAEALGVSRMQLNRILRGANSVSVEMALRLSFVFPNSATPREWLRRQAEYDLSQTDEGAIKKQVKKLRQAA